MIMNYRYTTIDCFLIISGFLTPPIFREEVGTDIDFRGPAGNRASFNVECVWILVTQSLELQWGEDMPGKLVKDDMLLALVPLPEPVVSIIVICLVRVGTKSFSSAYNKGMY